MTTLAQISIAGALTTLAPNGLPFRFTAYDGSATGPDDAAIHLHLATERGLSYILTAPGDLGLVRAYVMGDLEITGVHPANPYELMRMLLTELHFERPSPAEALRIVRGLGWSHLKPPPPPPQEQLPRWRRIFEGLLHSRGRDKTAIQHHYDVKNQFYSYILGPSMTYTCAVFPTPDTTLEQAQYEKYDLIARKLDLKPGMRLLDIGCGWGGMLRHAAREYGVHALGVTLAAEQAEWAAEAIKRENLEHLCEVRHLDYRDVPERDFDAISSMGMTEHIGVRSYPAYFAFHLDHLRPGGRLLNHWITRPDNRPRATGPFIDRYIFPDGELTGSGHLITQAENAGFEIRHTENLREHYALTLTHWSQNLQTHWDKAVAEVGPATAKIWALYLAAGRVSFDRNTTQLHQLLAVKLDPQANAHFPLRPTWAS
ncbi:class I SAM-dependent methyltransferase [Kribbella sandramycini]|uniref:Class I SAM-dependent methyltransferase n=1 Tax=Kribbella sandramycini TaxID=60450 RepID=A0A7Y4P372_9ACTN|nr:cyclopropane-fatty-acyl-phospholipid synthase family protein [Kribbella sandramycini]MBB6570705.1 cyclopropane-fatty-acyl-phospholipid synthase [Kribbella sandramycini]NOL43849.1 class I SAM-dependent methyltransferase [Kribbella sandramycini]